MSQRDCRRAFHFENVSSLHARILPGFTYMGEVDEQIAIPRRETPRTSVPKGSVGIAGRRRGSIRLDRRVAGRSSDGPTPKCSRSIAEPNSLLQPGDEVRFVPMS
jgi:inhibitor of KinA